VKGFSKRVEETGPKSVEAKKEIQVGAAAITTHRVPELNLLAASTGMAFLTLSAPCSDDGDGPPNALNAMRHPHLQPDVQPTTTRVDELHTRTHTRRPYHLARLLVPTRRRRRHPCAAVWPVYDDDLAHDKAHGAAHDHGRETGLVHHPCA
jgi:hypothetical protein